MRHKFIALMTIIVVAVFFANRPMAQDGQIIIDKSTVTEEQKKFALAYTCYTDTQTQAVLMSDLLQAHEQHVSEQEIFYRIAATIDVMVGYSTKAEAIMKENINHMEGDLSLYKELARKTVLERRSQYKPSDDYTTALNDYKKKNVAAVAFCNRVINTAQK